MGLVAALAFGVILALLALVVYQRRQVARLAARLSDAARIDPLTGLLNRSAFDELLDAELERSRRGGRPLSLLVGHVDGLGLAAARRAGDAVLELVGRDLRKWKRRIDTAGRIGREEFALLLPDTDAGAAFLVAERLRRAAHRTFADEPMPVTISFGVAGHPDHGGEAGALLKAAERAMAAAKELGGDRSVVYHADEATVHRSGDGAAGSAGNGAASVTGAS
jgi:diguanylate cyclase (GGDEF)-like protein